MVWKTGPQGRLAKSLVKLYDQIEENAPKERNRTSDGTIGNAEHQARSSDHNPWVKAKDGSWVVTALDITHDPQHGMDCNKLIESIRASKDPRVKYLIWNRRICSRTKEPWVWRSYSGTNPHDHHCHISVESIDQLFDDTRDWQLGLKALPPESETKKVETSLRQQMGRKIVDYEAQRDSKGRIQVYHPPANDGGGRYEVAGINERYHKDQADHLVYLIQAGQYEEAEKEAAEYVIRYTDAVKEWTDQPGVEFYLRDCSFNRGPKGAARILQRAVSVKDDGVVGDATKAAVKAIKPLDLLLRLRQARENYERDVVGSRANFWKGLVSRWDKSLKDAQAFQQKGSVAAGGIAGAVVAAAGGSAAATGAQSGINIWLIVGLVIFTVIAAIIIYEFVKNRKAGQHVGNPTQLPSPPDDSDGVRDLPPTGPGTERLGPGPAAEVSQLPREDR